MSNMPDVLETVIRKAKKEHTCNYCGIEIMAGEMYEDQTNVYDGKLYHWKSHLTCNELVDKLKMFKDCWYSEGLTADDFCTYVDEFLRNKGALSGKWPERIARAKQLLCNSKEATPCE
jgi:hypothetical protein